MIRGNTSAQAQVHLRSGYATEQLVYRGEFGAKGFLTKGAKKSTFCKLDKSQGCLRRRRRQVDFVGLRRENEMSEPKVGRKASLTLLSWNHGEISTGFLREA